MKRSQMFTLMGIAYVAPHMDPWVALICGAIALGCALMAAWRGE